MKKTIALLLALVLAIGLCACDVALPESKPFTAGSVANNHYESPFAGVTCDLSGDWTFMTDEQIRANNEQTMEALGEDYATALANATVVTDMFATHANGMDTVNVTFEKLSGANLLLTEDAYAELSSKNLSSSFESMGFTDMTCQIGKLQFAGSEHSAIRIAGTFQEVAVYETIAVVKVEGYMMLVTACTWYENTTEAVLESFH